jgi:3-hydroxyisobutyrate dehydrogenase-like beta-hydroxyacid dehydrogenase
MRVAFLGLGIMGSRMAVHLVRAGHDVTVWTRTPGKAADWTAANGGRAADSPADASQGAEAVISMVVDGSQVEAVLLGPGGAAQAAPSGTLFVDMSTIAPGAALAIGAELERRGHRFIDAPVTGSSPAADGGTLTIMAGGSEADLDAARPLFEAMGRTIVHAGPAGHGQLVKLLNNSVAAANAAAAAQALVAGKALGVDLERLVEVLRAGSGGSAVLELKARPYLEHDYSTLFKTAHMLKDVRYCLDALEAAGASFPAAQDAAELLAAAVEDGRGDEDYAALLEVVEQRAGVRI